MRHVLNWFEIATTDLDRAVRFYEEILGCRLKREDVGGTPMAIFPDEGAEAVGGALVHGDAFRPSAEGSLVYLNVTNDLDGCLARIGPAGGRVLMPRTHIGPPGFIAVFADTEGNRVGLHSPV